MSGAFVLGWAGLGTLYLVATPIGNLEDITFRAVRTLREVAWIAAEDTRTARILLQHYDIHTPVVSFHEYSKRSRLEQLLGRLATEDGAFISEAGTPAISDPGYALVVAALEHGFRVVPIPGPTAFVAALSVSGLPTTSFLFLGFLPSRPAGRRKVLTSVAEEPHTLVFYEAPHRLLASLRDMLAILGNRSLAIARELTKLHEEVWRGCLSDAIAHFEETGIRGEFTLVVAGTSSGPAARWSEEAVVRALAERRDKGVPLSLAAGQVASLAGWNKREVYRLGLNRL